MNQMDLCEALEYTINKMKHVHSQDTFIKLCADFFKKAHVDYFMLSICHSSSLANPDLLVIENLPSQWCKVYFERGFQNCDPITKYCLSNTVPILWHKLIELPEYSDSCYKVVFVAAQNFGLNSGISIPFRTATGDMGMLSLISQLAPEKIELLLTTITPYVMLLICHLTECIDRNNWLGHTKFTAGDVNLTGREYDCLFWACEGKTSWEISKILGVSERTALFHLNNAVKKIGAKNRQHAVAKGLLSKIIIPKLDMVNW
jgi:LuxR family transcriptional activator of bioluminescence operon